MAITLFWTAAGRQAGLTEIIKQNQASWAGAEPERCKDICPFNVCSCYICPSFNVMEFLSLYQSNVDHIVKLQS